MKKVFLFTFIFISWLCLGQNQKNFTFFKNNGEKIVVQDRKFKSDYVLLINDDGSNHKLYYHDFYRYEYDIRKSGISKIYLRNVQEMVCIEDNTYYLLPLIVEGDCNLYSSGGAMAYSVATFSYFIKRKEEKVATKIGTTNLISKNFKAVAMDYFSDCKKMEEKIKKRFKKKRKRLIEIVEFYNSNCE
ncbi:hypothetical protein [Winogradskyella flava]|uniref:Uncharacterized protein n=1 Tax=Winogradskyella flava TaxID=1884876 RepID=A0A842IVK7_9FLAO|nr:hypothetical protein [Winogradskyella flava]MBC2845776.1 hypothetical protein [Winogradskyella flava]